MLIAWSAIAEVCPARKLDDWPTDATAAYVSVLALAENKTRLRERVNQEFFDEGFLMLALAEISKVDLSEPDLGSENANMLRDHLSETHPVQYSSFHMFSKDGLDA